VLFFQRYGGWEGMMLLKPEKETIKLFFFPKLQLFFLFLRSFVLHIFFGFLEPKDG
jgi:hypothetical protein